MEDMKKELNKDEMGSVVGGINVSTDGVLLQVLIDVCKYDIGSEKLSALATNSKKEAKEYVCQNALPFMRNRCPGYSDAALQSFIDSYALKAINAIL